VLANRPPFDLVVVAASYGGLAALAKVLESLPGWFSIPIAIVQHLGPAPSSYLAPILNEAGPLAVDWAHEGDLLEAGRVYVAPPGRHLLVDLAHKCVLSDAARVNYSRPAADPLFQSAATSFGARVVAVVLTGRLHDAAAGAAAVRKAGGLVIAQSPRTCVAPGMPCAAIDGGSVNFVVDVGTISAMLVSLSLLPRAGAPIGARRAIA